MSRSKIKMISWNVNGMNAVMKKGFHDAIRRLDADVVLLQETKLQETKLTDAMSKVGDYQSYWSFSTVKKGYSGVAAYTRLAPRAVKYGIGRSEYDDEGRILEMDFGAFVLFNVYFPNGQMSDERLRYKMDFYRDFFAYADAYKEDGKQVVIAGDYNTAHNEIDLKNAKANENRSGFLKTEREAIDRIVAGGYVDTYRHLHPDSVKYSWWSYRFKARESNAGWRIDYFFATSGIVDSGGVAEAFIDNDIFGSDHCPVGLVLEV